VRNRRGTELTPAGEHLLVDAVALLAGASGLYRRVRAVAEGATRFVVGFMPGLTVTAAVRSLALAHPELTIDVLRASWADQESILHEGLADVVYVRLPMDRTGLTVRRLFVERRVAVLPVGHPLADRQGVDLTDLVGEPLLHPESVPEWLDVQARSPGRRRLGPTCRTIEEKLEHVAAGAGFSVLPQSALAHYHRPDVVSVPIDGVAPHEVGLAWVTSRRTPLIAQFTEIAVAAAVAVAAAQDVPESVT
jgi:DNA-binding transcriptional LysR family regulator